MAMVREVMQAMDRLAPRRLACEGDPVGLQAGDPAAAVSRVLVALEATPGVVAEAKKAGAEMIVCHHPLLYRGRKMLPEDDVKGALVAEVIRSGLAVFAAHTNLDIAEGGVADCLADAAGMSPDRGPLSITGRDRFLKLTVFVPGSHLDAVRGAVCAAGAGAFGEYSDCTFRTEGTGAFRCGAGANPHIGQAGSYEEVAEWRLESRLAASDRQPIEAALRDAHPYEEPAYDFALLDGGVPFGLGRVGAAADPATVNDLAAHLRDRLRAPGVQIAGDGRGRAARIAVWSGSGLPVDDAIRHRADVLVTGECGYHEFEAAAHRGLPVIRLGHGASERVALAPLARRLRKALRGVKVSVSTESTTPFRNV
jgi:dinuclear metal center YbgI/SA1388 family protein